MYLDQSQDEVLKKVWDDAGTFGLALLAQRMMRTFLGQRKLSFQLYEKKIEEKSITSLTLEKSFHIYDVLD